ncbi:helix-turn-helix domain-containing protein [Actinomadura latina]|uniref:Helix-turn-helix transcriptional regulator n=1 Tax=Actinomadura latina TaxID=163603 RepID=A0A846YXV1_9ACTN|nr:helix-turn-helix transcriptional regulator [Actinomadura latina]NKZ02943.1 helix-turn-helix transcriptional regulator [Actinomadura latina]
MAKADRLDPDNNPWHWLAADLRIWRLERNLSQAQLAEILGVDTSTVSNYESGTSKIPERKADILDQLWRTRGHFVRMRRYAESMHNPDWRHQNVEHEARASVIRAYESSLVPGLIQTEGYARAGFESAGIGKPEADELWEQRSARQTILDHPDPPQLYVLLDQAVITRHVGGREVMREQLARLLEVADWPHTMLRIIPWEAGAHMGQDGAFKLMTVERGSVVYIEAAIEGRLITDAAKLADMGLRWERIGARALPESLTRRLIADQMESKR